MNVECCLRQICEWFAIKFLELENVTGIWRNCKENAIIIGSYLHVKYFGYPDFVCFLPYFFFLFCSRINMHKNVICVNCTRHKYSQNRSPFSLSLSVSLGLLFKQLSLDLFKGALFFYSILFFFFAFLLNFLSVRFVTYFLTS